MNIFKSSRLVTRSLIGALGLSAIALFGVVAPAAAEADCGPGEGWVNNCEAGTDHFSNSWINIHLWWDIPALEGIVGDLPDDFSMEDWIMVKGPVWVEREAGENNVINTTLSHTLSGNHDFFGPLTLETTGTGQITEVEPGLADSFFEVDFTLNGMFGGKTTIIADRLLKGVSPDAPSVLPGVFPNPSNPTGCPSTDSVNAAVIYCNTDPTTLFYFGADGEYGGGDDIVVGTIHSEEHIIHIPEPSMVLASIFGLGAMLGLKRKKESDS
ncbi:PEP-CTERM sorting domain-containing protein [Okeania sp. SIO1I7]|uniref:PEP-CTERM sorting domain-containing protein n=1 Tax=Okeania sp. SIO1I7 TaxID=2607772 RepID=UPI0013F90CD8|nr:PEP-CTERM sorting domain-containing protein [Okeania sp. SIO1I7]NET28085.1 PEP-CTERM sorting domain-containing protein [Okeania sp. SIO1I7]